MLQEKRTYENGCSIGIWQLEESSDELLHLLNNKNVYKKQISEFSNKKRKQEWLAARVLLKTLCEAEKTVAYHSNGKPYLVDNSFEISISHTKNLVAVIIHPNKEVGIDIEQISDRICPLKEKFLSLEEIENIDNNHTTNHLLLHWCAKEVLFKMINEEGVEFAEQLHIAPFVPKVLGQFSATETRTNKKENYTLLYRVEKEFILVWSIK
jgi:phosphopantetheinyl transferase